MQPASTNTQNQPVTSIIPRIHENLKQIYHFSHVIPLPPTTQIYSYQQKFSDPNKKTKLKHKYDRFTYYRDIKTKQIIKIIFLNDEKYIDQGKYPFTQPLGNINNFSQLNVKRMKTTQAAYIGHVGDQLIVKKMDGVKLGQNGSQFQTVDDKFEVIRIGIYFIHIELFRKLKKIQPVYQVDEYESTFDIYVDESYYIIIIREKGRSY